MRTREQHATPSRGTGCAPRGIRRYLRRGNALIMAVALTAMLAIIGSTFVLVARLERQTVRSFGNVRSLDDVQDFVIRSLQTRLAQDVTMAGPLDQLAGTDCYDAPASVDPWLAATEPVASGGGYQWPHISDVFGPYGNNSPVNLATAAVVWTAGTGANDGDAVDADGDGIADSVWRQVESAAYRGDGKNVYVAVRVIDTCGLLNVNTVWGTGEPFDDLNGNGTRDANENYTDLNRNTTWDAVWDGGYYGLPTQVYPHRLLKEARWHVNAIALPTSAEVYNWTAGLFGSRLGRYAESAAEFRGRRADWVYTWDWLRYCERPFAGKAGGIRFFDLGDELALRNRFFLKKARETSRLETTAVLGSAIGDYTGTGTDKRPSLPYAGDSAVDDWGQQLLGVPAAGGTPRPHDLRHLLTTYSFDRTVRPPQLAPHADTAPLPPEVNPDRPEILGVYRQVDVNEAVNAIVGLDPNEEAYLQAGRKLIAAVLYARKPLGVALTPELRNQAVQFVANLRDYIDSDHAPTHFTANYFGPGLPAQDVFGFERQPYISEVFVRAQGGSDGADPTIEFSAVELCNPYTSDLTLDGFSLTGAALGGASYALSTMTIRAARQGPDGYWRPGRLILASATPAADQADTATEPGATLAPALTMPNFTRGANALHLVRTTGGAAPVDVLVDFVSSEKMESVTAGKAPGDGQKRDYSIERSVWRWHFARNEFNLEESGDFTPPAAPSPLVSGLGRWYSKPHPHGSVANPAYPLTSNLPRLESPTPVLGVPLPVADRGPAVTVPGKVWLAQGWYDIGRVIFLGNPSVSSGSTETVPQRLTTLITSTAGPNNLDEGLVRFDLGAPAPAANDPGPAHRLFRVMSFFARCDDGVRNEAGGPYAKTAQQVTEYLTECRIPGRINVNTAPEAVLRAVFPMLPQPTRLGVGWPAWLVTTDADWHSCLDLMAVWFARAVVDMRSSGPFTSMDDLLRRLDAFSNGPAISNNRLPAGPGVLRFRIMARAAAEVRGAGVIPDSASYNVGDPFLADDLEERDWLFGRIASVLTVRSDTFTAYVLIRLQDANAADHSDRRFVAILDRSNVFFPPSLARNGSDNSYDLPLVINPPNPPLQNPSDERDRLYVTPQVIAVHPVGEAY